MNGFEFLPYYLSPDQNMNAFPFVFFIQLTVHSRERRCRRQPRLNVSICPPSTLSQAGAVRTRRAAWPDCCSHTAGTFSTHSRQSEEGDGEH